MTGTPNEALLIEDLGDPAVGISAAKARSRPGATGWVRTASQERCGRGCSEPYRLRFASGSTLRLSSRPRPADILDQHPISCLRAAWVVVALATARAGPAPSATIRGGAPRVHPDGSNAAGRVADSRSRRSTLGQLRLPIPRPRPPDQTVPGSTARNRRRASSASYRARSTINSTGGFHRRPVAPSVQWPPSTLRLCRSHGLQEGAGHRLIDPVARGAIDRLLPELLMELITFVQGILPSLM